MRIAYVCADPGVPVFGRKGASIHVQEMVRALRTHGAAVDLFATRVDGPAPRDLAGVPVHPLPSPGGPDTPGRERRAVAANTALREALGSLGPFDLVYERYALWSFAGMTAANRSGVPGVLEINAPLVEEQARHRVLHDRATAERVARVCVTRATVVVAVSEAIAEWARVHGADPGRVHVVPNGVDPRRFEVARGRPRAEDFTVGFVGTLKPWHGVDVLVRATAMLARHDRRYRLLVVGDGPERAALAHLVRHCGIADRTTFTGAVAPGRIPSLLARMDVATAPYATRSDDYFSPLKVVEYLAAGVPVAASDVGQVGRTVTSARAGLLTPPGDVDALASALATLQRDPRLRRSLGANGRRWVTATRSWNRVAGQVLRLAAGGREAA